MHRASRQLLRLFATGLLAALPLAATVAVFAWIVGLLWRWLGPDSAVGSLLARIGFGVTGSEIVGYGIGVALVVAGILGLGVLVELGLERGLASLVEAVVSRIPIVRNVYDLVQRFVALLSQRDADGTRAMRPVWCTFGGRETPGAVVLALQTAVEAVEVDGRRCVAVLVPTAPVPVGGGLLFVPEDWVTPAALSVEAVTALYVSMGVTAPQHLGGAKSTPAPWQHRAMNTNTDSTSRATPRRVAFLGLGVMGDPMAGHLVKAGHAVTVYNRTASKAADWAARHGGATAATPREAAAGADVVAACVGNDDDLRGVVLGEHGAFAGMKPGAVFVDHTTASAEVARELHATARERGLHFIDAPVSGGQAGAVNGVLTVMCGGDPEPFAAAQPVVMAYARACTLLGGSGSGQLAKMVNQVCIAGLLQGLAEALAFGQRAGLDMPRVLEVIGKGAAQSWQMDNRGPTMLEGRFDFGFAVDWMRKDLGLVLDEARRNGAQLPVTALVDQFYADVQALGGRRWDTSSLIERLKRD